MLEKNRLNKKKVSLEQIQMEIKPFLRKGFLQRAFIDSVDVDPICCKILQKYSNVEIAARPGNDGKLYLIFEVKKFFGGGVLQYELKVKGRSVRTHRQEDTLSWIDRIEDWDAIMDD